jgi:hypothetical protein
MGLLRQLFCKHKYEIREWYPLDKDGEKLFEDTGLFAHCMKCGKHHILYPKIPKEETEQESSQ